MQITNSVHVVCDASKGCIYKQIKLPLVGEHAFPLTGFVCKEAHVTALYTGKHFYLPKRTEYTCKEGSVCPVDYYFMCVG